MRQAMTSMRIKIRPARPDDAPFLSWVILASGRAHVRRGIWEVILGRTEEECLTFFQELVVTETPHLFHYSCYLVAEVDERPVGALGGHDPRLIGYPALQRALPSVFRKMGFSGLHEAMSEQTTRVLDCIPASAEDVWIIDSVATLPEFRRRGIVSRLLKEMLEIGRQKGFGRAQINIYIGNTAAQRAYEKYGFKWVDEARDAIFEAEIGAPGMARLLRDL